MNLFRQLSFSGTAILYASQDASYILVFVEKWVWSGHETTYLRTLLNSLLQTKIYMQTRFDSLAGKIGSTLAKIEAKIVLLKGD